ncbi:MAG: hypothetical protein AABN95_21720 [Acidobacteriota bacterium]
MSQHIENLTTWNTETESIAKDEVKDAAIFLVSARAHFSTVGDDKKQATRLEGFINFYRGGPPILAAYMDQTGVEFPDPSHHDIPLRIENNTMFKRDLPGSQFLIRITVAPNDNDRWEYNVVINLVFSDATVYGASGGVLWLDENHIEFPLPLY